MTTKQVDIAIVGAASLAGEAVLSLLAERKFPLGILYAVDVVEQTESHVEYKDDPIPVHELAEFDFSQVQLAIFLTDAPLAAEYAPKAVDSGCIVIDSSICFRHDAEVPLIIPGINDEQIANYRERMLLATPSSATSQLLKVLYPVYEAFGIEEVVVTVMQAVSEMGKAGQEELGRQTAQLLNFQEVEKQHFPAQIAFNLIPQSGIVVDSGHTSDELDMIQSTQKILSNDKMSIRATVVTAPVFFGTAESIAIRTQQALDADRLGELLENTAGVKVEKPSLNRPITPVDHASGKEAITVARLRSDGAVEGNELSLWSVADNIRSGVALNSVQTAEILVKDYL